MTIGGTNDQDFSGNVEWYNSTSFESVKSWNLVITSMDLDHYNLIEAPPADPTAEPTDDQVNESAVNVESNFTAYAHFNSGFPFLGVDTYVADMVEDDLKYFRPDVSCQVSTSKNPWGICYWEGVCQDDIFNGVNLTFSFGSNATFVLPTGQLMINYTMNNVYYCGLGV